MSDTRARPPMGRIIEKGAVKYLQDNVCGTIVDDKGEIIGFLISEGNLFSLFFHKAGFSFNWRRDLNEVYGVVEI